MPFVRVDRFLLQCDYCSNYLTDFDSELSVAFQIQDCSSLILEDFLDNYGWWRNPEIGKFHCPDCWHFCDDKADGDERRTDGDCNCYAQKGDVKQDETNQ